MLKDEVLSFISSRSDEIARFTQELVAIPTENPPGHFYRDCVERIGGKLEKLGLAFETHEVRDPSGEISLPRFWIESFHGEGRRTLYFHGHYDVVPASGEGQFRPVLKGGRLYGRGSSDMKGGLAAMIFAVEALKECKARLEGRVGLMIVPDEETGGQRGSRYIADSGRLGKDGIGMLTAEPTSGVVWNASRGALTLEVKVKGRSAHVGLHYQGVNAFEKMIQVADALLDLKRQVESRKTEFRIEPEEARSSILMMGGLVEGGDNFNLVPGECRFTLDRRINPEEDLVEEKARLLDVLEGLRGKGIELEVEILQEGAPSGVSEESPLGRALAASIEEVTGKQARFEMCPGLLECRFYAERGIPAFALGPGLLSVSHGPDEYVEPQHIHTYAVVYALTAARLLSKP